MLTKEFSIILDMVRENTFRPFEVVECDTGNRLQIHMQNNGEPMDLTGCNICMVFASKNGFRMQDLTSGVSIGEDGKSLFVELYAESFGPGEVTADVQVYSGEDHATLITSKRFTFRCITALMSPDIIAASATYPPLIAATKAATDAAKVAREAVEQMDQAAGEMNVQSDWLETDTTSDAFIKNKPFIPQTAEDVGAMPTDALPNQHGNTHSVEGMDPITPESIGAEKQRLQFTNKTVAASAFVANTTYEDFPYRAAVELSGVTAAMVPEVVFGVGEATSGIFAPVAQAYDGGIYLYASEIPEADITIPTIICWKAVG